MSETFFDPFMNDTMDDTVTTMGGQDMYSPFGGGGFDFGGLGQTVSGALSAFPFLDAADMPAGYDIPDYLSRVGAENPISAFYPGVQARPLYIPGLTDLTFTRGYYGPEEDVIPTAYGTESAGTRFWSGGGPRQLPPQTTPAQIPSQQPEAEFDYSGALGGLFGAMAAAAASSQAEAERLARLEAGRTNIVNTFTPSFSPSFAPSFAPSFSPSNVVTVSPNISPNISPSFSQSQSQWQQQSMGGGGQQNQGQGQGPGGGGGAGAGGGGGIDVSPGTGGGGLPGGGGALDDIPFDADLGFLDGVDDTAAGGGGAGVGLGGGAGDLIGGLIGGGALIGGGLAGLGGGAAAPTIPNVILGQPSIPPGALDLTPTPPAGIGESDITPTPQPQPTPPALTGNAAVIENAYQTLFGRSAEPAAIDYWGKALEGGMTPDQLFETIILGAQGDDRFAVQGRRATSPEERARFGEFLNEQDINNPNLTPADREAITAFRDIQAPLQQAAADFARLNPGAAAGATVDFADFLVKTNPDLVANILNTDSLGSLAEGIPFASAISSALSSEDFPEFVGKASTGALTQLATTNIASALGIPGAGPVLAAAVALDSVLSRAFGYDSPIQDGISWVSRQIERGVEGIGDFVQRQTKNIFNPRKWRFQEGGLVDLPGGSWYNSESAEVLPDVEMFAGGGVIPLVGGGKIAMGPGGGLDDLIPTSINGRRAAALSDGEFVIPADVVSMMGDGSSNEGARRLYRMVREIRQDKTGTSRQAGPLPVGKILERTMS